MVHATPARDSSEIVAGRYRIVQKLARGGMGDVFQADDLESGGEVALKRLREDHAHHELLFRAEYHALSQLQHPHVIDVHDYGVEDGLPFYTMELLDGQDLIASPPTSVRESCRMLRDLASSLALLHAHRLLHRDINPRNVRRTADGGCKLFDFGVMVPFGVPPNLAGTPPFVSPEAWEGSVLDQRSDLYSLGALAYWLLTRTFPYEPKKVAQRGVVGEPPPARVGRRAPEVPAELDTLVMSLLELDPAHRPSCAAEVIIALNQIADLDPDESAATVHSYLASARFVSRGPQMETLDQALEGASAGRGGSFLVAGPPGIGRTRFLQQLARLGQTRGMQVVRAFGARVQSRGELAREIFQVLRRMDPDALTLLSDRHRTAIRRFEGRPGSRSSAAPGHARAREVLHEAMVAYAHAATAQGQWLLLVDDLDLADSFSAGLVSSLSHASGGRSMVVVAATRGSDGRVSDGAASSFARGAQTLWLDPLTEHETRELAGSLFGEVPHLDRLVHWLYREAHGNPGLSMELASLLLRRDTVHYAEGAFVLPRDSIDLEVPADLAEIVALRLEPTGQDARHLAELLSLCRGSAALALCLRASDLGTERTLSALEELVRHGVLVSVRGHYAFAQDAMRSAVQRMLSPARSQALHAQWVTAYREAGDDGLEAEVEVGWHLLHTEGRLAGADLMYELTPKLFDMELLSSSGTLEAAERALQVYEEAGAPLARCLAMRSLLVRAGYLYDWRLATRYGEETIGMLERWLSLDRLRPWLPKVGSGGIITLTLLFTLVKWLCVWGRRRGPDPYRALQYLGRCGMSLLGVYVLALDREKSDRLLAHFELFRGTPKGSTGHLMHLSARSVALQPRGREPAVREGNEEALRCLAARTPLGMSDKEKRDITVGLLLSLGINECYRVPSRALQIADQLDQQGTRIGYAAAQRVRVTYHLVRADKDAADHHQRMLEMHAIQGGTTWQVDWFSLPLEATAAARNGDLVAGRAAMEGLQQLAGQVPSLASMFQLAQVMYQHRRGNLEVALEAGSRFVEDYPPGSLIGWASAHAAYANALNDAGHHEEARVVCERAQAWISEDYEEYAVLYGAVSRELAYTYAALGRHVEADALTERNIIRYEEANEPALLMREHQNAARIALLRDDVAGARVAVERMLAAAERTRSRFALAHMRRAGTLILREADLEVAASGVFPQESSEMDVTPVEGRNAASRSTRRRLLQSLELAMEERGAAGATLFSLDPEQVRMTASLDMEPLPPRVEDAIRELADATSLLGSGPSRRLRVIEDSQATFELLVIRPSGRGSVPSLLVLRRSVASDAGDLSASVIEKLASSAAAC